MLNNKVTELQNKAILLLRDFKVYSGALKRLNAKGEDTRVLEFKYVPIDRRIMNQILQLKLEADLIIDESGKKDSFYHTMKLIKHQCTITSFEEKAVKKYQLITSKEKVIKYLPGELERRTNILKKKNRNWIANNTFSDDMMHRIHQEELNKITHAEEEVKRIIDNPNEYEILITTAEDDLSYPTLYIKYTDENGDKNRYNEHLREDNVLNIFVYEPDDDVELKYAKNKKIKNLKASGAEYLLGTILYKLKS